MNTPWTIETKGLDRLVLDGQGNEVSILRDPDVAAFLVKCVNSHAPLKDAVEAVFFALGSEDSPSRSMLEAAKKVGEARHQTTVYEVEAEKQAQ